MSSYLITGTSRGLGLAFVKYLLSFSETGTVIATARSQSAALKELSDPRLHFLELDVGDNKSIQHAANEAEELLGSKGLDVLINNAGVMSAFTPNGVSTMPDLESTFKTNVAGVHHVTSALLPLLRKGSRKEIVNVSSTLGSFGYSDRFAIFPVPAYKISKAALNMLTVQYASDLAKENFICITISPGWVKTDLGSDRADLTPEQSAEAVFEIIHSATLESNGHFIDVKVPGMTTSEGQAMYLGGDAPW